MRHNKRLPNRYLAAFLFGRREINPEIYAHFARRFTRFKEGGSKNWFNWHAWLWGPLYYSYRKMRSLAFFQSLLFIALLTTALASFSAISSIVLAVIWLLNSYLAAYKSDYRIFNLYRRKIRAFKAEEERGFRQLQSYGGGSVTAVIFNVLFISASVWALLYFYGNEVNAGYLWVVEQGKILYGQLYLLLKFK